MCVLQIVLFLSLASVQPSQAFDVRAQISPTAPCRAALWIEPGIVTVEDMARDVRLDGATTLTWHVRALADVARGPQWVRLFQDGREVARAQVEVVDAAPPVRPRLWLPMVAE